MRLKSHVTIEIFSYLTCIEVLWTPMKSAASLCTADFLRAKLRRDYICIAQGGSPSTQAVNRSDIHTSALSINCPVSVEFIAF